MFQDNNLFSKAVDKVFGNPQDIKTDITTLITVTRILSSVKSVYRLCGTAKCGQLP